MRIKVSPSLSISDCIRENWVHKLFKVFHEASVLQTYSLLYMVGRGSRTLLTRSNCSYDLRVSANQQRRLILRLEMGEGYLEKFSDILGWNLSQFFQEVYLPFSYFFLGNREGKPCGPVHFRKFLLPARTGRPFHREGIALNRRGIAVSLKSPGCYDLATWLLQWR